LNKVVHPKRFANTKDVTKKRVLESSTRVWGVGASKGYPRRALFSKTLSFS